MSYKKKNDFVGKNLAPRVFPSYYRINKLYFEISDQDRVRVSPVAFDFNFIPGYRQWEVETTLLAEDFNNRTLFMSINDLVRFLNQVGRKLDGPASA